MARMEESRNAFKILKVNLQKRDLQEGLGVDWKTLLEWILKKSMGVNTRT